MRKNNQKSQKAVLNHFWSLAIVICLLLCIFAVIFSSVVGHVPQPKKEKVAATPEVTDALESGEPTATPAPTPTPGAIQKSTSSASLSETSDGGAEYLNQIYFFGDGSLSTLNDENLLSGEESAQQVWIPGAEILDLNILSTTTYVSPVTGNNVPAAEVVEVNHPKYVVILPSVDNVQDVTESELKSAYTTLIGSILLEDPETVIILSSLTPVTETYVGDETNAQINTVNGWIAAAAEENNVKYLDAAYAMAGADGYLPETYSNDGAHLGIAGFKAWLEVVRTHVPG